MKKVFKLIFIIILCVFLIAIGTGVIDYFRMTHGKLPIFNVSSYDSIKKKQVFQGMLYRASRKVRASDNESLSDSSNYKFKLLTFDLFIPNQSINENIEYNFITKNDDACASNLYYADLNKKVYTYCLSSVMVNDKELLSYFKKDKNIIDNIENTIDYTGLYNNTTMIFKGDNIKMYHCRNNDVYIGNIDMEFQDDFCTEKDDDLKFIFEIKEETKDVELKDEEEVFFEDENYKYTFDKVKSDYIFITTPENRGREAKKISLKEVLNNKLLSIDDLEEKGLSFKKVNKNENKE